MDNRFLAPLNLKASPPCLQILVALCTLGGGANKCSPDIGDLYLLVRSALSAETLDRKRKEVWSAFTLGFLPPCVDLCQMGHGRAAWSVPVCPADCGRWLFGVCPSSAVSLLLAWPKAPAGFPGGARGAKLGFNVHTMQPYRPRPRASFCGEIVSRWSLGQPPGPKPTREAGLKRDSVWWRGICEDASIHQWFPQRRQKLPFSRRSHFSLCTEKQKCLVYL